MPKGIAAGKLRHRVAILRDAGTSPNSVGQLKPSYSTLGTFYALVECLGGAEAPNGDQLKGTLKYKVTVRASAGPIRPSDQISWNGHTLNVVAAVTDPFGIMIEVEATEKVATQ